MNEGYHMLCLMPGLFFTGLFWETTLAISIHSFAFLDNILIKKKTLKHWNPQIDSSAVLTLEADSQNCV